MQKLKQILKTKKIIIVLSIILAVGIITITNAVIAFVNDPLKHLGFIEPVLAEVNVPTKFEKEYKYNERVPIEIVKEEIKKQAKEFSLDEKFMLDLAFCESSYNNLAKNEKSTALGVYQWLIKSWEATDSFKLNRISRTDYKANITEAMKAIKRGEEWRWSECLN